MVLELLGGQEVLYDEGRFGSDHVLAHAALAEVLPGFCEFPG
jgi:hypothetical protein